MQVVISAAWKEGTVAWMSAAFGIVVAFLFLHGVAVLRRVRRKGRARFGKVLLWLRALSLVFTLLLLPSIYLGDAELVLEGADLYTPLGFVLALLALCLAFFILALGMLCAACSAMWFLVKAMRWIVPGFLSDVRKVKYSRRDGLLAKF
jgi:FtsH-binding integral membrane protein